jgi:adenosylcobinamide-GDP ribazoletransferase
MKTLTAAFGLLTRIPLPAPADAETAGQAARWFPLVGASLGAVYAAIASLAAARLPSGVAAVLVVIGEALLTGALHMDGLADTADGFGGGKDRADILRIMRDHAVGSYGAAALALLVALKVAALAALIDRRTVFPFIWLAPVLARWSIVPLSRFLAYARPGKSAPGFVRTPELLWATLLAAAGVLLAGAVRGIACWAAVAVLSAAFGGYCRRKIGGITGDTLGANVEICESAVLVLGLIF